MNPRFRRTSLFLLCVLASTSLAAEPSSTPATETPKPASAVKKQVAPKPTENNSEPLVRVDVLMVSLPDLKALPLLPALRNPNQIQEAQEKLLELVAKKEASLEGWPEVTARSGTRAVSESITEQRYPIEFQPPQCQWGKEEEASKPGKLLESLKNSYPPTPTAFETRNTGPTLETEATVSPDGSSVELTFTPGLVRLESMRSFVAGVTAKGEKLTIEQPIFSTARMNTTLSLRDGERRLIYVGKTGEPRDRMDLFIVGVKIFQSPTGKR